MLSNNLPVPMTALVSEEDVQQDVAKRARFVVSNYGYARVKVASAINLDPADFSRWLRNEGGSLRLSTVHNLAAVLRVPAEWLLLGTGTVEFQAAPTELQDNRRRR